MGKIIKIIAYAGALVAGVSAVIIFSGFWRFEWIEMDWNEDGKTTLPEIIASIDIDYRSIKKAGSVCKEYYSLKDGLPVKLTCDNAVQVW